MAKTKTEEQQIVKAPTPSNSSGNTVLTQSRPAWLTERPVVGMEEVSQYVVFPRMKIVQKSAGETISGAGFGTGDLILVPDMRVVARIGRNPANGQPDRVGPPVLITPLYFFVEWMTWNPIALKGTAPAIAFRTRDPKDPVVAKSRSAALRMEPYKDASGRVQPDPATGQPLMQRHVEHLNWIVVAHDSEGVSVTDPFTVGFSRAEHFTGSKFASLVQQRHASIYACKFEMLSAFRPGKGKGDWYGVDLRNPEVPGNAPWCDEAEGTAFERLHEELKAHDKERVIRMETADAEDLQQDLGEAEAVGGANVGPRTM
jgi:hypothetical protein